MKRLLMLFGCLAVLWALPGFALGDSPFKRQFQMMTHLASASNLGWKVGDTLNFSMQLKPLPKKGTMKMAVTKDEPEGITLIEDIDVGPLKQTAEILVDRDTGEIKRMIVNGKQQALPDGGSSNGTKVIAQEESHIKVPAGEFDAIHLVTQDENGQTSEAWVNPVDIPISGILKTRAEQGIVEVNTELVSFARGN